MLSQNQRIARTGLMPVVVVRKGPVSAVICDNEPTPMAEVERDD